MKRDFIQTLATMLLILPCLSGCQHDYYDIELKPNGEALERNLTYWNSNGQVDPDYFSDEIIAMGKLYETEPVNEDDKFHFTKEFTSRMPDDVGGHGTYKQYSTSLGDVYVYMERFRGSDDLATELDKRREATNDLTDLIVDLCKSELKNEDGFQGLLKFIDKELRNDLQNLSIYTWRLGFEVDQGQYEPIFRLLQFLMERGYIELDEIALLSREIGEMEFTNLELESLLGSRFRKILERKLPNFKPIVPKLLELIADKERILASIQRLSTTSNRFFEIRDKWILEMNGVNNNANKDAPADILAYLALRAILPSPLLFPSATAYVSMHLPQRPDKTNGKWDEDKKTVNWQRELSDRGEIATPDFVYAYWMVPNKTEQINRFGRVIYAKDLLAQQVLWFHGLTKTEQAEWNMFVGELEAVDDLIAKVKDFVDSTETPILKKQAKQLLEHLSNEDIE